jgi:hypothetical protein
MERASNNSGLATGLTNDQLALQGEDVATTPVGRSDSDVGEQQTVVNSQNQDQPVNGGGGNNANESANLDGEDEDEEEDMEDDDLEEEDFEVDEEDVTDEEAGDENGGNKPTMKAL